MLSIHPRIKPRQMTEEEFYDLARDTPPRKLDGWLARLMGLMRRASLSAPRRMPQEMHQRHD